MGSYKYLTTFSGDDESVLEEAKAVSGLSINQIIVKAAIQAAKGILAESRSARVTNVEPLSAADAATLYREREDDEESIRRFMAAQPKAAE